MKTRVVRGGGLRIYQLIVCGYVISIYKNSSWSNGDVHGWRIGITDRKNTAL